MNDTEMRLAKCFQAVFPDMTEAQTFEADQDSVEAWDSLATVTLITVIDDEFRIQLDVEKLAEMTSFRRIQDQLTAALQNG